MTPWNKIKKAMQRYFYNTRWYVVVGLTFLYGIIAYLLLLIAGEQDLISQANFIYWLVTTASTVGYGDFSPQTETGKWIVSLYVIPFGLSLFAWGIGHFAAWLSEQWRRGAKGLKPIHLNNHVLVIGWNGNRTQHLLDLLLREGTSTENNAEIVLCVKAEVENPLPGKIEFVKVDSFNADSEMDKACIQDASTIIIDNPEDDVTMTTALYCAKRNPHAHKVAYFKDESLVDLMQTHCPRVECTPSVAVEMLAKAAFDPGSSKLHHDLLSVNDGQTQYSLTVPESIQSLSFEVAFMHFKRYYNATIISLAPSGNVQAMALNPKFDIDVNAGDKLFYIAEQRVLNIDWQRISNQ